MIHKNTFKLCLGILLSFMMLLPTLAQNTKSFKGVVVDETGEPIIGAAVKVVDTTIGTITDLNGKFVVSGKVPEKIPLSIWDRFLQKAISILTVIN